MATRTNASGNRSRSGGGRTTPTRTARRNSDPARSSSGGGVGGNARGNRGREVAPADFEQASEQSNTGREPRVPAAALTRGQRIGQRLSDATSAVRGAGSTVTGTVAANPVPAALIGAGVAWLLFGNRVRGAAGYLAEAATESDLLERAREQFDEVSERVSSRLSGAAGSVKDALAGGTGNIGESLGSAAGAVRDGASRLGEYAADGARAVGSTLGTGASAVGEQARRGYEYSRQGVSAAWHEHPLTSGLALLAAGVAIGMFLPGTLKENELMGDASDAVARRVKTAARKVAQRGKEVASTVTNAVMQEAKGEGLGAEEVVRKARRIAGHVQEATVKAAKRAKLDPVSVLSESEEE